MSWLKMLSPAVFIMIQAVILKYPVVLNMHFKEIINYFFKNLNRTVSFQKIKTYLLKIIQRLYHAHAIIT